MWAIRNLTNKAFYEDNSYDLLHTYYFSFFIKTLTKSLINGNSYAINLGKDTDS